MNRTLTIYAVMALMVCALGMQECARKRVVADRDRLERNQQALFTDIETLTDQYGREVKKVAALELTKKELKTQNSALAKTVEALNLKVGRLQTLVEATSHVRDSVAIPLAPPVVIERDSFPPIIQRPFKFEDTYSRIWGQVTFNGDVASGEAELDLNYSIVDTLDVIVYRTPKRFLFIPYGIKRIDCFIRSRNPHSTVVAGSCTICNKK